MTPAVASERSIFSKNHDYNNYIKESFPCRGEHVRTYISWGAVCVKTLFKKEAIDIFYISTTFIIHRRHLLYIDDIYYIGSDYSYGTVNGFFVAILTALTSVLSYAKLPYYAYLFKK